MTFLDRQAEAERVAPTTVWPISIYRRAAWLQRPAKLVVDFDLELRELIANLAATLHRVRGVGLAAPQIGFPLKVAAVNLSLCKDFTVHHLTGDILILINPQITAMAGRSTEYEGCLSIPGFQHRVPRAASVTVRYADVSGDLHTLEAEGLLAHAVQHEVDHLDGKLWVDRVSSLKRSLVLSKIQKLERIGAWGVRSL